MEATDLALLVLRIWLGVVMVAHGINHGRSLEGTAGWFESKGFRNAKLNAVLSCVTEIAVGFGLVFGLLTSFAAAGLIATMFVAYWSIHRSVGFFVFKRPDEGYEYVATLAIAGLVLAMVGPGEVALDSALGIADIFDDWIGLLIAGGGVFAAMGQLVLFWRKPIEEKTETQ